MILLQTKGLVLYELGELENIIGLIFPSLLPSIATSQLKIGSLQQ